MFKKTKKTQNSTRERFFFSLDTFAGISLPLLSYAQMLWLRMLAVNIETFTSA